MKKVHLRRKPMWALLLLALGALFILGGVGAMAWTGYYTKVLHGQGEIRSTTEVEIVRMIPIHPAGKYNLWLKSTSDTVADKVYTVQLNTHSGDNPPVEIASLTVSWTEGEIPGTTKKLTFTRLTFGADAIFYVEIT